ncbi:SEC-C domain-containing protein [bacterium]|nr:SEC-C domain-containing protein [bacterium]
MGKKKPDVRGIEKDISDLKRAMEGREFESKQDVDKFLKNVINNGLSPKTKSLKALDKAQDLVYDAWEEDEPEFRIKLAEKALKICPDCADAYNLLAEETACSIEEEKALYEKAVKAGERALGKKIFKNNIGSFWGFIETRPYMRARAGLARCLWELGEHEQAIKHYREMLILNPGDNQGIRYVLVSCLGTLGRFEELEELLCGSEYDGDWSPHWLYTKALLIFRKEGRSEKAEEKLSEALKQNCFVPDYLTGKKVISSTLPDRVTVGGDDEAMCYASDLLMTWLKVPGAIDWAREKNIIKEKLAKVGRNDLCPCGSGKKYKKCCGIIMGSS